MNIKLINSQTTMENVVFIKYCNKKEIMQYIKTNDEFQSRIVDVLIDNKIKLSKASAEEWQSHITVGTSYEAFTESQTRDVISEILGI